MKLPLDIERELIRKLINGDKIAFSHLFSFYKSQVLYYCVHFVKDKEIAEDITQDIFLTVWEKKEDIRIEQSFSAFLYTIARNRIYDIFRSLSARSVLYEKLMEQAIDYVDDVEKSLEEKNIQELIAQALEQLSPRQREILRNCWQTKRQTGQKTLMKLLLVYGKLVRKSLHPHGRNGFPMSVRHFKLSAITRTGVGVTLSI